MFTDGQTKLENGVRIVERNFSTEPGVATIAGPGVVHGGGILADIAIIFGAAQGPNSITYSVKDSDYAEIAAGTITKSTRGILSQIAPVMGEVNIALSGNAVVGATGKVVFYFVG